MKRYLAVSLGAALFLAPFVVKAAGLKDVESMASSDGSWTAFTFPQQISGNARIKVTNAKCEKPEIANVQFVLVPKGKCQGAAGSPQPKGATRPDKIEGTSYKLSEKDLCVGAAGPELKCVIYADTQW